MGFGQQQQQQQHNNTTTTTQWFDQTWSWPERRLGWIAEWLWFRLASVVRPGSWPVTFFAAYRTVCVMTVWSPSRGCVVAVRSVARFCGLRNFLHDFVSSHVSGTGAPVATSDVSIVKFLRELKNCVTSCWYRMMSCWRLGALFAFAKNFVSYGKLWREPASIVGYGWVSHPGLHVRGLGCSGQMFVRINDIQTSGMSSCGSKLASPKVCRSDMSRVIYQLNCFGQEPSTQWILLTSRWWMLLQAGRPPSVNLLRARLKTDKLCRQVLLRIAAITRAVAKHVPVPELVVPLDRS